MRPIRRINRCSGKNQNGKCCKNKKMKYSDHCFVHSKNEDCCICYEPINSVKKLDCSHFFCKDCIYKWIYETPFCPCCRTEVGYFDLMDSLDYSINSGTTITVYNKFYTFDIIENGGLYSAVMNSDFPFGTRMYESEWGSFRNFIIYSGLFSEFLNFEEEIVIEYLKLSDYQLMNLPPFFIENGKKYLNTYSIFCY
jgi:hypothetical protein